MLERFSVKTLRIVPIVAIDFCASQNAAQQIDANVTTVRIGHSDSSTAGFGHVRMFPASEGTIIPQRSQLAYEFSARAQNQGGHQPLVVLNFCG